MTTTPALNTQVIFILRMTFTANRFKLFLFYAMMTAAAAAASSYLWVEIAISHLSKGISRKEISAVDKF